MFGQLIRLGAVAVIGGGAVFLIQQTHAGDTIDGLAADPARLREVQRLCSRDWASTGDALCSAASKAPRKRFMGSGTPRYTPHRVEMFPSLDEDSEPNTDGSEADGSSIPAEPGAE